jgi:crossover junction endodeoxyribonuclease RusA
MIRIDLPKPPSVNALFFNAPGRGRVKTKEYRAWIEAAGWVLLSQKPSRVTGPVALEYLLEDAGRIDLGNYEKPITDLLVSQGIIEDDKRSVVRRINLSWSPEITGCQVTITPETK